MIINKIITREEKQKRRNGEKKLNDEIEIM